MTPQQAQPILATIDALGAQIVALRHQMLALIDHTPTLPVGAPCGHRDAVETETREGRVWVCGEPECQ